VEQRGALEHLLQEDSRQIGISIDPEQTQLFLVYLKQLQAWNESFNLTAITKDEEIIVKHFIDSLAVLKAVNIEPGSHILDIGTGAGFPGIPLKILRPDLCLTLVEPVQKKISFLRFLLGLLRLKGVDVFHGTVELFSHARPQATAFNYITTRALNPSLVFSTAQDLLNEDGKAIIYSARPLDRDSVHRDWVLDSEYTFELPHDHGSRTISAYSHRLNLSPLTVPRGT